MLAPLVDLNRFWQDASARSKALTLIGEELGPMPNPDLLNPALHGAVSPTTATQNINGELEFSIQVLSDLVLANAPVKLAHTDQDTKLIEYGFSSEAQFKELCQQITTLFFMDEDPDLVYNFVKGIYPSKNQVLELNLEELYSCLESVRNILEFKQATVD